MSLMSPVMREALRPRDPWPLFDEVYDSAGTKTGGQPFYKLPGGRRVPDLRSVPDTTFTRATTAIAQDADGTLREVASGEPAIGRGRGVEFWSAIQNKCVNENRNPVNLTGVTRSGDAASTLTVVDDVAALAAAGLQGLCTSGKVFCLNNSAGTTNARATVDGATGNTNSHTFAAFIRGGTGWIGRSPAINQTFGASTSYQRRAAVALPPLIGTTLLIEADPGQVVYFILNSLTETAYVPPVIAVAGAAATRNADTHQKTALALNPAGFVVYDEGTFEARLQNSYAYEIGNGGSLERFLFQSNASDQARGVVITGGNTYSLLGPTLPTSARVKSILRWNGGLWDLFVNGVKYTNGSATFLPSVNSLSLGQRVNGSDLRKGAQAAFAIRNRPGLSDADCVALTTL